MNSQMIKIHTNLYNLSYSITNMGLNIQNMQLFHIIIIFDKQLLKDLIRMSLLVSVTLLLAILQLVNCSSFTKCAQSLELPASQNLSIHKCGYNSPTYVSMYNGTVFAFDRQQAKQLITFNTYRQLKCLDSSQQIPQGNRILAFFNPNLTLKQHKLILFRHNTMNNTLSPIYWQPFTLNQSDIIQQIDVSSQFVVFVLKNNNKKMIMLYNLTSSLTDVTDYTLTYTSTLQPTHAFYHNTIYLDVYNNIVLYSKIYKILGVYSSQNYAKFDIFTFHNNTHITINISNYILLNTINIGQYSKQYRYRQSQLLFNFMGNQQQGKILTFIITILPIQNDHNKIQLYSSMSYQKYEQVLACEDRLFIMDYHSKCIRQQQQYSKCVIDRVPVYGAQCSYDHSSRRVKLTLAFATQDGSTKSIQVYQQQINNKYYIIYILIAVILIAMLIGVVGVGLTNKLKGRQTAVDVRQQKLGSYISLGKS